MPITPFHFGPGVLFASVAPRRVSFVAFVAANCITDVESIYNILRGNYPVHAFLHTFAGATLVIVMTLALFLAMRRLAQRVPLPDWLRWRRLTPAAVVVGAALGSYSHIVLDGVMHADMRPFAPWSQANPFLHRVPLGALHLGCVVAAIAGGLLWWFLARRNPQV